MLTMDLGARSSHELCDPTPPGPLGGSLMHSSPSTSRQPLRLSIIRDIQCLPSVSKFVPDVDQ